MYNDSRIILPRLTKPVTFPGLMAIYESNYVRVLSFLGLSRAAVKTELIGYSLTWKNTEYQIDAKVEEVTKYTTLLCIDEDIYTDKEPVRINHFRVRLYHDAQVAAVHSSLHARDQYHLPSVPINKARIRELWQQNMFFNKWLEFCADRQLEKYKN